MDHQHLNNNPVQSPQGGYVYPHPPQNPGGPPNRKPVGRSAGLVAIFLAVAVVFAALGGTFVYYQMNDPQETSAPMVTTAETGATTQTTTEPTHSNDSGKHFSVADAATRQDRDQTALSIMEIAAQGKPAVVAISTTGTATDLFGRTDQFEAAGSGFVVSSEGYIVTNNHVIEGADTISVVMDSGEIYDAVLVAGDSKNDIAVIQVEATNLPTVILGDSDDIQVGELAVAIGNPLGELSGTVTAGIISALDRQITIDSAAINLLQTDAAINPGNSGGALFNSFGEVIAINTAKTSSTGVEGLGFAIPINDAIPIIDDLINYGYVKGRTKIGISTQEITQQMSEYYKMAQGIYVVEIESGSAADKAGLEPKDIIIAANGVETLTVAELTVVKDGLSPGDALELTIVRDDVEMTITVILEEDTPS